MEKQNGFRGMKNTIPLILKFALVSVFAVFCGDISADTPERWLRDSLPSGWNYRSEYSQTIPPDDRWWSNFDDSVLDSLIRLGVENNFNLNAAGRRIESARQSLNRIRSAYSPEISVSAGWQKVRSSGAVRNPVVPASTSDYFSLGLTANWEIDVFGRIAAQSKAGKAMLEASKADREAVMVALCANIAKSYISLRMYQAQKEIFTLHLESQEKILKLAEARFEAGIASMLDVTQAKEVLLSTRSDVPRLDNMIETSINAIGLLVGEYPDRIKDWLGSSGQLPEVSYGMTLGIPADLLRRRPDVVEAEYSLAAAAAKVGIAKKDFLPVLSLSASVRTSAHNGKDLFTGSSFEWSVAPTLSWTVFDGLSRNYGVRISRLDMEESIDNYNETVMTAVNDVYNAMSVFRSSLKKTALEKETLVQNEKALDLSVGLYKKGLTPFSNVVDAQINCLNGQNNILTSRVTALTALVNLYEALGGGWEKP